MIWIKVCLTAMTMAINASTDKGLKTIVPRFLKYSDRYFIEASKPKRSLQYPTPLHFSSFLATNVRYIKIQNGVAILYF